MGIDLCSLADLVQGGRVETVSSVLGSCGIEDALAGTPGMREFGEMPQAVQYGLGEPLEIVIVERGTLGGSITCSRRGPSRRRNTASVSTPGGISPRSTARRSISAMESDQGSMSVRPKSTPGRRRSATTRVRPADIAGSARLSRSCRRVAVRSPRRLPVSGPCPPVRRSATTARASAAVFGNRR